MIVKDLKAGQCGDLIRDRQLSDRRRAVNKKKFQSFKNCDKRITESLRERSNNNLFRRVAGKSRFVKIAVFGFDTKSVIFK